MTKKSLILIIILATLPVLVFSQVNISLPASINGEAGSTMDVALTTSDLTAYNVYSFEFDIQFDTSLYKITGFNKSGTISSGMSIVVNTATYNKIKIAAAGFAPLSGGGTLGYLTFEFKGVGSLPLVYSKAISCNEGSPSVTTDASVVTVTSSNVAPSFQNILPDTSIMEESTLAFTYTATDPESDALTFALVNPIDNASITSNGSFSFTPSNTQSGSYEVIVSVSDGINTVKDTADVTVTGLNFSPQFESVLPDTSINENESLSYSYTASDPEDDPLTFALVNPIDNATVNTEGNLSWTPSNTQAGVYNIIVSVTDGTNTVNDTAVVTVVNVNIPSEFTSTLPDTSIKEGKNLAFTYTASNEDMDDLTFALVNPIDGMIVDPDGCLSWTPTYEQEGNYEVIVSVTDSDTTITDTASVIVEDGNKPPSFVNTIYYTIVVEGSLLTHTYTASDPEDDALTFSMGNSDIDGATIDSNGEFSWRPTILQRGDHIIVVSVTDGNSIVNDTSNVKVIERNYGPIFTSVLPDTTINENTLLEFTYTATDENDDALTFALVNPINGMAVAAEGSLSWTPNFDQAGSYEVIVSVSDADTTVIDTANVTVINANRPPAFTVTLPDTSAIQNLPLEYIYTAIDPDDDELTFVLVNTIDGMAVTTDGNLSWTPTDQQIGVHEVIVSVSDGSIAITDTASVTVPVNITFEVNMSIQVGYGEFNYSTDAVDVAGSFNDWGNDVIALVETGSDTVFSTTVTGFTPGETIEYKFRINSNWDTAEFPNSGPNRAYEVPATNSVLTHWYNDEDPNVSIDEMEMPKEFSLSQNYPNPFNPTTNISYTLPFNSQVKLTIYNMLGNKIVDLVNSNQTTGIYNVSWLAGNQPSGIYFYSIEIKSNAGNESYSNIKKMMLVK